MKKPLLELKDGVGGKSTCCGGPPTPRPSLAGLPRERRLLAELLAELGPSPVRLERLALGRRFLAVAAGDDIGLASTLGAEPAPGEAEQAQRLIGAPLDQAAALLLSDSPWLASLGLAALNAARPAPPEARPQGADALLARLAPGRRVVVLGDFPFIASLDEVAGELQVLELRPGAATAAPEHWERILASCQVAAITATALLTRSLAWALESAAGAVKVVVGPSTPWSPVLFAWGADYLAGSRVTAPQAVLTAVGQDLPFRRIKKQGVEALTWERPGGAL